MQLKLLKNNSFSCVLLISGNFSSPMNSLVCQTDHSDHFFIKHLSGINLRFKGKRGAPGELQKGEGHLPSADQTGTPQTTANLKIRIPMKTGTLLTPFQTWSLTSCTDVSSCFFASQNYYSFKIKRNFNSTQIIHLPGEKTPW